VLGALLDDNVRWGGDEDTPETCHTRTAVLNRLDRQRQAGLEAKLLEVVPGQHGILVALKVRQPAHAGHDHDHEWTVYQSPPGTDPTNTGCSLARASSSA